MLQTRSATRKHLAQAALGPASDKWLPIQVQHHILDLLLAHLRVPEQPRNGLYANNSAARDVAGLQLVCRAWRGYVQYHPHALLSLRLHQLLRLSHLHDWVHFIVDSRSKASKARLIPTHVDLTYPSLGRSPSRQAKHSGEPSPQTATATTAQQPNSPTAEPAGTCPTVGAISQGAAGANGSLHNAPPAHSPAPKSQLAAAVVPGPATAPFHRLRLSVLSGKARAEVGLGLPATCCVLACSVHDLTDAPASTLQVLAAELQLLDQVFSTSLILTVTVIGAIGSQPSSPPAPGPEAEHAPLQPVGRSAADTAPMAMGRGEDDWRRVLGLEEQQPLQRAGGAQMNDGDAAWAGWTLGQRLRGLALLAVSPHLAVECDVVKVDKGVSKGTLWLIPTFSRINRRVPFDPSDPVGHLTF